MRTWFSLRRWVTHLAQIRNAEFSAQQTAAKPGRKFYPKMKTQAASTSFSIRIMRTSCSRLFGKRDGSRGFSPVAVRAADCIDRTTTAPHGDAGRGMVFPMDFSEG